jgi:tight adherence protein B
MAPWIPAALAFIAVVFGTLSLALLWEALKDWLRRRRTRRHLEEIVENRPAIGEGAKGLLRDESSSGFLGRVAEVLPGAHTIESLLRQGRVDLTVESFVILVVAVAAGAAAASYLLVQSVLLSAFVAMLGAWAPYLWVSRRRTKRLRAFEEQFPEAIELLTRAIRAGHPVSAGIRMVAEEAPEAVAEEFRQLFEEQRFGLPFEDALLSLVDRLDSVDVRIFATALLIQRDVGGNLAEILDNLAETIRGRFYIRRQLRVYTAQGRLSGWILGLLPVFVAGVIFLIQRDYMMTLFGNLGGLAMLGAALTLQLLGVLWIRRIINIDI